jgi:hypothetical protein
MPEDTWDETRIAEVRSACEAVEMAADNLLQGDGPVERQALSVVRERFAALGLSSTRAILSLLDALVSPRRERDEERERADDQAEAFADVMGALATALDGDDEYYQRPAEVVWKLRNQRDEAQEWIERLEREIDDLKDQRAMP